MFDILWDFSDALPNDPNDLDWVNATQQEFADLDDALIGKLSEQITTKVKKPQEMVISEPPIVKRFSDTITLPFNDTVPESVKIDIQSWIILNPNQEYPPYLIWDRWLNAGADVSALQQYYLDQRDHLL